MEAGSHDVQKRAGFDKSVGLTSAEAQTLLEKYGRNELPESKEPSWKIFLSGFWGPMPLMIWIAAVVEMALGNFVDGAILFGILLINATISWHERIKSGNAIAALKQALQPKATVKRDGVWQTIDSALVVPGDLVKLASGSSVPCDCLVNEGHIDIDQSSLTGESLPVTMGEGDAALMGSTVVRGEVEGTADHTGAQTYFGRTAALLSNSDNAGGNIKRVILRITVILSVLSLVFCTACLIYLFARGESTTDAIEFPVTVLVASIPLAIDVVVTTTLALGARELSQKKAIVARLAAIEELAGVNILCSDKTGTLTLNKMVIQSKCPTFMRGYDREKVLVLAALAAKWREPPRDALDTMVLEAANLTECDKYEQLEYMPFDPIAKRTSARLRSPEGEVFEVSKGAPHIILNLIKPRQDVRERAEEIITKLGIRGIRCLSVAKTNQSGTWELVGFLTFSDPPRHDTARTIELAHENGIEVKMITGDHLLIAKEMARTLNLGTNILTPDNLPHDFDSKDPKLGEKYGKTILDANGFAQVHPEHKFLIVQSLKQLKYRVGMTGDGVNDAPALKCADVGIAVSGATDAARSAADIVLTEPGLSTLIDAVLIARRVFQRMRSFVMYRISATVQLLLFFVIALFAFRPTDYGFGTDPAGQRESTFFRLPVLMIMLITLLNDGTLMTIGYDRVVPPHVPMKWNLRAIYLVSFSMSCISLVSSLLLLWMALDSPRPGSVFRGIGLPAIEYGKVITLLYLKISVSDFLTLFSARANDRFFCTSNPHPLLWTGAIIALSVSSILASFWPRSTLDGQPVVGLALGDNGRLLPLWVIIYCLFWFLIQDLVKVLTFRLLHVFGLFGYHPDAVPPPHPVTAPIAEPPKLESADFTGRFPSSVATEEILRASTARTPKPVIEHAPVIIAPPLSTEAGIPVPLLPSAGAAGAGGANARGAAAGAAQVPLVSAEPLPFPLAVSETRIGEDITPAPAVVAAVRDLIRQGRRRANTLVELRVPPSGLRRLVSTSGFPHEYAFDHHLSNMNVDAAISEGSEKSERGSSPDDFPTYISIPSHHLSLDMLHMPVSVHGQPPPLTEVVIADAFDPSPFGLTQPSEAPSSAFTPQAPPDFMVQIDTQTLQVPGTPQTPRASLSAMAPQPQEQQQQQQHSPLSPLVVQAPLSSLSQSPLSPQAIQALLSLRQPLFPSQTPPSPRSTRTPHLPQALASSMRRSESYKL